MEKDSQTVRTSLRIPPALYEKLDQASREHGMTMHAEILGRLERTFAGNLPDLSAEGFAALIKQMEAAVETSFHLVFDLRDTLPGLDRFMLEHGIERREAVRRILNDWLAGAGYVEKT